MALVQAIENGKVLEDTSSAASSTAANSNEMGYDQFLQLLCAEMQYQDPLEPTSNTEYVAQLATFSQMEATLSMQSTIESSNANSLVGQYVIIKTTSSTGITSTIDGFVDYVQKENGKQMVSVNGNLYDLSEVYQVADSEYVEAITVANAFSAQVLKMPEAAMLTLEDKTDVENLTKVYQALTSYQKSYISSDALTKYKALIARMSELTGSSSSSDAASGDNTTAGDAASGDNTTAGDTAASDSTAT